MAKFNPNPTREIIVLCGPPGCGKDHYIATLNGYYPVSFDAYVELERAKLGLNYEEAWRDAKLLRRAEKHVWQTIQAYLQAGVNIVWNGTNLTRRKRRAIVKNIPEGYVKNVVCWELSNVELQRRHKKRFEEGGKNVDYDLCEAMMANYSTPGFDEGWDILSIRKI